MERNQTLNIRIDAVTKHKIREIAEINNTGISSVAALVLQNVFKDLGEYPEVFDRSLHLERPKPVQIKKLPL